jgi:hypothetical protein
MIGNNLNTGATYGGRSKLNGKYYNGMPSVNNIQ